MQSGGGDECPSLGHLAGHGRERERGALMVEVGGSVWRGKIGILENIRILESWKSCGLWRKERIKEKEKGKEIIKRRYFLLDSK